MSAATVSAPILQEYFRLKTWHATSKVNSAKFQPNDKEQRRMIIKNISARMIAAAMKREKATFIFEEKMRIEKEEATALMNNSNSDDDHNMDSPNSKLPRTRTAPLLTKKQSSKRLLAQRPENLWSLSTILDVTQQGTTTRAEVGGNHPRTEGLVRVMKNASSSEEVITQLQNQAIHRAKDGKKLFEAISKNYKPGSIVQFNPRRSTETIDFSHLNNNNQTLSNVSKIEDLVNLQKKDGIFILLDPSIQTFSYQARLRITYHKVIDLGEQSEMTKEIRFWSDGNYYGMQLLLDPSRSKSVHQNMNASGMNLAQFIEQATQIVNNGNTSPSSLPAIDLPAPQSLPGWNDKLPIFIPSTSCTLQVIVDSEEIAAAGLMEKSASIAFNLSRLKLFAFPCADRRAGLKKLAEFLKQQLLIDAANVTVPGGLPVLHCAALYGNMEAVQTLVFSGANINFRCRNDKLFTPLHEAVIGGHVQIVKYLLKKGANQLQVDERGMSPLHYACKLNFIDVTRVLMESAGGRRALLLQDFDGKKPYDLATNNFLKSRVEAVMRKHKIFSKPRVALIDRV